MKGRLIKIYSILRKSFIIFLLSIRNFKSSESIIIFSEARGGSTWLMEMLVPLLKVCINWEPLHVNHGVVPKSYNFGWYPFIPKNENNSKYLSLFKKIHTYKIHSYWTRDHLTVKQLLTCKYVLTKYVRANLLVPYLLQNFNFKFPPIFLLRHPIDICISQIKAFNISDINSAKIEIPNWINSGRFIKYNDYLHQLETSLEIKVAYWCMNNCPTISQLNELDVHVVFYSDLLLNPKKELQRILDLYHINASEQTFNKIDFRKSSSTDFNKQLLEEPLHQLNKNFNELDNATKDKIQKVFDYFEFKIYSAYSPLPQKQYLAKIASVQD